MENFWSKLPKPFFALAPLEDVTDAAFRRLIAAHGKPHVMFTEFISADGLCCKFVFTKPENQKYESHAPIYSDRLGKKLLYSESERPIVAQLFSAIPEHMEQASRLVAELGFDGVDINMGCPDRAVEKGGCGAALIKEPALARALIVAAKRGSCTCRSQTCTSRKCISVSVKTRIGYNKDELETWLPELLAEKPAAITLHARTRKEMSDIPAHWERVERAVAIRDEIKSRTLILGNGDVRDTSHARELAAKTGADGIMLGRAIFGNPWLFSGLRNPNILSARERIASLTEHLRLFEELLGDTTPYATMKKHFKAYISGWRGAKELRVSLMETENSRDARKLLESARIFNRSGRTHARVH